MNFLYGVTTMTVFEVNIPDENLDDVDRETIARLQASRDERALALWWEDNDHRLKHGAEIEIFGTGASTEKMREAHPSWMIVIK